jgi:hypothetical protein
MLTALIQQIYRCNTVNANSIQTYCYIYEVSLDTQQCWTALAWLVDNNLNKQQGYAGNNR